MPQLRVARESKGVQLRARDVLLQGHRSESCEQLQHVRSRYCACLLLLWHECQCYAIQRQKHACCSIRWRSYQCSPLCWHECQCPRLPASQPCFAQQLTAVTEAASTSRIQADVSQNRAESASPSGNCPASNQLEAAPHALCCTCRYGSGHDQPKQGSPPSLAPQKSLSELYVSDLTLVTCSLYSMSGFHCCTLHQLCHCCSGCSSNYEQWRTLS